MPPAIVVGNRERSTAPITPSKPIFDGKTTILANRAISRAHDTTI